MRIRPARLLPALLLPAILGAQEPRLAPGEGFVLGAPDGAFQAKGEVKRESPLGDLAALPWLRLEGREWGSRAVQFACKGEGDGIACGGAKGHGKVDLREALARNCRRALLAWIRQSAAKWGRFEGEAVARLKLLEVFEPFLGRRMPPGEGLPAFDAAWCGEGDLLRATPEGLARWLADPAQEGFGPMLDRLGQSLFKAAIRSSGEGAWAFVGRAGSGEEARTWVVAGKGGHAGVFRLVGVLSREAALARIRGFAPLLQP